MKTGAPELHSSREGGGFFHKAVMLTSLQSFDEICAQLSFYSPVCSGRLDTGGLLFMLQQHAAILHHFAYPFQPSSKMRVYRFAIREDIPFSMLQGLEMKWKRLTTGAPGP